MAALTITGKPTGSTVEYKPGMAFYLWTKIRSGYATKVIGEHSHPHLQVGGLTNNANIDRFAFPMTAEMGQLVQLT